MSFQGNPFLELQEQSLVESPYLKLPRKREDRGRRLGTFAGLAMIVGVLFPFILPDYDGLKLLWPWEMLGDSTKAVTGYFGLTLVGGLAALVFARALSGARRAFAWLAIVGALLALQGFVLSEEPAALWELPGLGSGLLLLGLTLTIAGTFVGHAVAREQPDWYAGYVITAVFGTLTTVLLGAPLLPTGQALVSALLDSMAWRYLWGLNFFLVLALLHALYCQLGYLPAQRHSHWARNVLRLGKVVIFALPVYIVVMGASGDAFLPALSMSIKFTGPNYGYLMLLAVGMSELLIGARRRNEGDASADTFDSLVGGGTML